MAHGLQHIEGAADAHEIQAARGLGHQAPGVRQLRGVDLPAVGHAAAGLHAVAGAEDLDGVGGIADAPVARGEVNTRGLDVRGAVVAVLADGAVRGGEVDVALVGDQRANGHVAGGLAHEDIAEHLAGEAGGAGVDIDEVVHGADVTAAGGQPDAAADHVRCRAGAGAGGMAGAHIGGDGEVHRIDDVAIGVQAHVAAGDHLAQVEVSGHLGHVDLSARADGQGAGTEAVHGADGVAAEVGLDGLGGGAEAAGGIDAHPCGGQVHRAVVAVEVGKAAGEGGQLGVAAGLHGAETDAAGGLDHTDIPRGLRRQAGGARVARSDIQVVPECTDIAAAHQVYMVADDVGRRALRQVHRGVARGRAGGAREVHAVDDVPRRHQVHVAGAREDVADAHLARGVREPDGLVGGGRQGAGAGGIHTGAGDRRNLDIEVIVGLADAVAGIEHDDVGLDVGEGMVQGIVDVVRRIQIDPARGAVDGADAQIALGVDMHVVQRPRREAAATRQVNLHRVGGGADAAARGLEHDVVAGKARPALVCGAQDAVAGLDPHLVARAEVAQVQGGLGAQVGLSAGVAIDGAGGGDVDVLHQGHLGHGDARRRGGTGIGRHQGQRQGHKAGRRQAGVALQGDLVAVDGADPVAGADPARGLDADGVADLKIGDVGARDALDDRAARARAQIAADAVGVALVAHVLALGPGQGHALVVAQGDGDGGPAGAHGHQFGRQQVVAVAHLKRQRAAADLLDHIGAVVVPRPFDEDLVPRLEAQVGPVDPAPDLSAGEAQGGLDR